MTSTDIKFYKMLKKYGFKKVIFSSDALILVIISILMWLLIPNVHVNNDIELIKGYTGLIATIAAAILAIVIAALAIIISMINDSFLKAIHDSDSYYDFVFPFYLSSINWIFQIIINLCLYGLVFLDIKEYPYILELVRLFLSISVGCLLSGLKGTSDLLCTSIGLGLYRNEFISRNNHK